MEGLVASLSVLASDTPGSSPRVPLPAAWLVAVSEPHWEQCSLVVEGPDPMALPRAPSCHQL